MDERVTQYSNLYSWLFWPTVLSNMSLFFANTASAALFSSLCFTFSICFSLFLSASLISSLSITFSFLPPSLSLYLSLFVCVSLILSASFFFSLPLFFCVSLILSCPLPSITFSGAKPITRPLSLSFLFPRFVFRFLPSLFHFFLSFFFLLFFLHPRNIASLKLPPRFPLLLWSRITNNPDCSTGPLACPFAHSPAPLTRLLAPPCSLCSLPRSGEGK